MKKPNPGLGKVMANHGSFFPRRSNVIERAALLNIVAFIESLDPGRRGAPGLIEAMFMAGPRGLEPPAFGSGDQRSIQLSYGPASARNLGKVAQGVKKRTTEEF